MLVLEIKIPEGNEVRTFLSNPFDEKDEDMNQLINGLDELSLIKIPIGKKEALIMTKVMIDKSYFILREID
jgi:hypothetical protein